MTQYEIKEALDKSQYIEMTTDDGVISIVPMVEGNSDYQAYLNKDKPQTPAVIDEATAE